MGRLTKIEEMLKGVKVEWKKLGEICTIKRGRVISKSYLEENYGEFPVYSSQTKNDGEIGRIKTYDFDGKYITWTTDGAYAGTVFYRNGKFSITNICGLIKPNNEKMLSIKFLFYWLQIEAKKYVKDGSGNPKLMSNVVENIKIPIPPIEIQEKIVETLDKFTNYVTELKAELKARERQYSFYRDKLLSEEYLTKISERIDKLGGEANNVRFTTLGDVGVFTRGNGLQKKDFQNNGRPVIHYGQIYTQYDFSADKTISFTDEEVFKKLRKAKPNDILMATTSENIEDVGKSVVWLGKEEIGFSGDMYSYSTNENSKYIAYYFQSVAFQKQKERKVTGTKLIRIHAEDMEKFDIILPPISIQEKVVRVLDKFQELLSDTQGLLPQEIEQRQKQYKYYRDKLLTFNTECDKHTHTHTHKQVISNSFFEILREAAKKVGIKLQSKIEWKTLRDITFYSTERISYMNLCKNNYVGVENLLKNKQGKVDSNYVPSEGRLTKFYKDDILVGNIRPYLRKIWMADTEGGTNGDVLVFRIHSEYKGLITSKFLYQVLSDEKFFDFNIKHSKGAKMPRGDKGKIMEYSFPLPPLEVQKYIVEKLDKFETLVHDITEGLPKEIELREKQYIYYREKLLNFSKDN